MGLVVFEWDSQKLTLLMIRKNWDSRVIKAAAWDEKNNILGIRCEENEGTWFGCSKGGRVAFLVDTALMLNLKPKDGPAELIPVQFLEGSMSPRDFADGIAAYERSKEKEDEVSSAYHIIVADITSSSMFHIARSPKKIDIKEVNFGMHIVSMYGLDSKYPRDHSILDSFTCMMVNEYKVQELPPLNEFASRLMYGQKEVVVGNKLSSVFDERMGDQPNSDDDNLEMRRYGTTSIYTPVGSPLYYNKRKQKTTEKMSNPGKMKIDTKEEINKSDYLSSDGKGKVGEVCKRLNFDDQVIRRKTTVAAELVLAAAENVKADQTVLAGIDESGEKTKKKKYEMRRYGTTSTIAFVANPNREVKFYERFLEVNGEWKEHNFSFKIE